MVREEKESHDPKCLTWLKYSLSDVTLRYPPIASRFSIVSMRLNATR
jgi:hypothetical protein